jgi:hypothetical protein
LIARSEVVKTRILDFQANCGGSAKMHVILTKLVEAAEARAAELMRLAESADDRGSVIIEADASKWRDLAKEGREALHHGAEVR